MIADVVVGLQHGDEAKGKVAHHLCKEGKEFYTHVLRYNGGGNAGHTIYHKGEKFVTHYIPAGVFHGIKSILGSGCVINVRDFFSEMRKLEKGGVDISLVRVAKNCHVITEDHLYEDAKDEKIGTTKRGNGPAYRDKYNRKGQLAESVPELEPYLIDLYEEFHNNGTVRILCEGAQGYGLDIDWGDYPYVTSSHCTAGSATLNAIPPSWVRHVWGVGKVYETYVGKKNFEPDDDVFNLLRHYGKEYGATTGRPRQCNWLNLDELVKSVRINGATHIVLNKTDVLEGVGQFKLYHNDNVITFDSAEKMYEYINRNLSAGQSKPAEVIYSGTPHGL
jgi:adenylosuccinate synthase